MKPIGPGLLLVGCPPTIMPYVTATLSHVFGSGSKKKFGLPIPKRAVTVCLSGPTRFQDVVRETVSQFAQVGKNNPRFLPTTALQALNWARPEAFQHLVEAMAKLESPDGSALIAYQDLHDCKVSAEFKEGLVRVNAAAIGADATFVLIAASEDAAAIHTLVESASDVAVLREQEPDPDFVIAFDVMWLGIESLHHFGWGHSLVQIALDGEGDCDFEVESFTGSSYQDRIICAGVQANFSQSDIARDLAISRATVSRSWSGLKICSPRADANAWYRKQVERLKVEREQEAAK